MAATSKSTTSKKTSKAKLSILFHGEDRSNLVWPHVTEEVLSGRRNVLGRYLLPDGTSSTLLEKAWSEPAERASWSTIEPFVRACMKQGHSPYMVSPVRSVPDVVQDPEKLQGWLSLGVDPCALAKDSKPVWWGLIDQGNLVLLNLLVRHPGWAARMHENASGGGSVLKYWANGGDFNGTRMTVEDNFAVLDWLHERLGEGHATLDEPGWASLLERMSQSLHSSSGDGRVSPAEVWERLVRDRVPDTELDALIKTVKAWAKANKYVWEQRIQNLVTLTLEQRALQATIDTAIQGLSQEKPPAPTRRRL